MWSAWFLSPPLDRLTQRSFSTKIGISIYRGVSWGSEWHQGELKWNQYNWANRRTKNTNRPLATVYRPEFNYVEGDDWVGWTKSSLPPFRLSWDSTLGHKVCCLLLARRWFLNIWVSLKWSHLKSCNHNHYWWVRIYHNPLILLESYAFPKMKLNQSKLKPE